MYDNLSPAEYTAPHPKGSIHNQVEQPMSSSSHRPRQWFHLSPADKMTLPPPADQISENGNQPIDIMYSSKHGIWYYLYRAHPEGSIECGNQVEKPIHIINSSSQAENKGSIGCGNQVEKPIDIMNSSSHHLSPAENKGSIECGNQVEQPIDIINSSLHHLSPAENKGNIECGNQVEKPIDIMNSSSHHLSPAENKGSIECGNQVEQPIDINSSSHRKRQRLSPAENTTLEGSIHNQVEQPDINVTLHGKDGKPFNLVFSSSHQKWFHLTPDKKMIPARPWYLCPTNKSAMNFLCGSGVEEQVDILKSEKPERYKEIVHVCKFALNHYKDSHPDKPSYEFESVEKAYARAVAGKSYSLTFKARNVEDGKLAVFETHANHLFGKELEISRVELLPE